MRLLIVFGTRPEALKCFPVVRQATYHPRIEPLVCVTAQHREMLDQVLTLTRMAVDFDLDVMTPHQSLDQITSAILQRIGPILTSRRPDMVLVQGDTTTAMAAAMAAYYQRIPVAHIEAGLRSGNIYSPWPEEVNRKVIGDIAALHFAPTPGARDNLLREAKSPETVFVTGNTGIDTLLHFSREIDTTETLRTQLLNSLPFLDESKRLVLVTCHRRENFDDGIERICSALESLAARADVQIVYPVHPNPKVRDVVMERLGRTENVHLIAPQDYLPFVFMMKRAYLILTDSGGVQEEAPALGKPVLVLRENTERPEGLAAGTAKLVGTRVEDILGAASLLLDNPSEYERMSRSHNPYGDGKAGERIVEELQKHV